MKLLEILKYSSEYLQKSGINNPSDDAEALIFHAAAVDKLAAYRDNQEVSQHLLCKINKLLRRRTTGEPVQYIIGHVNFLGLKIKVGKGVLIPRPETELLVQEAAKEIENMLSAAGKNHLKSYANHSPVFSFRVLDLCTGSGCIALSLAKKFPSIDVYGSDISEISVKYANENAAINRIANVTFLRGSLFEHIKESPVFNLIISNPPYIKRHDIKNLQREIRDWEPAEALDGGTDGIDFYRNIFSEARRYLKKNGRILLEIGYNQSLPLTELAKKHGFKNIITKKDYAGIQRLFIAA